MVQSDLEAPISGASRQAKYGSAPPGQESRRGPRQYAAVAAIVGVALVAIACFVYNQPSGPVFMESAAEKALKLEMSKRKYDSAKQRVAKLHSEFDKLKEQLEGQVQSLDAARGDLVSQIKSAEGVPVKAAEAKDSVDDFADADLDFGDDKMLAHHVVHHHGAVRGQLDTTAPFVTHLRDAASALAAAGTTNDAADAAKHALSYTQQVAARVGDLADQSEKQAEKIVDAARLTQEAKDAMRAALEQSSQIVDYNTHAAQAVAQDSGFVTTAAQTISGYLHNIFHDSQAVHQAAVAAVKHMNDDVTAADHAVSEIEADAREAYDVLTHISAADKAATGFAKHARAAAVTAATAANGALKGERAAMVGGLKAISSAHSAKAGAQAAMEYARAAQAAVHPYVYGQAPANYGTMSPQASVVDPGAAAAAGAPVAEAKELVDSVVVLMQQLTNALETNGHDCDKVRQILTYYQAQMARYHVEGQGLAGKLNEEDMSLIEQYAQTQVGAFAGNLEAAVRTTASTCNLPVSAFIPDASIGIDEASSTEAKDPMSVKAKVLKSELRGIAAARQAVDASRAHKSAKKQAAAQIDSAVAAEQRRIQELRKQVASLKAEKARLHQQK